MIESNANSRVKLVRRLQSDRRFRHSQRQFVVEGTRWLHAFAAAPHLLDSVFYTEAWRDAPENEAWLRQTAVSHSAVADSIMASMSDTETPPGILALAHFPQHPLPAQPALLLIVDGIQNPGNLGTMLRTAVAVGVDAVLLAPGTVDPFNPKVVRSSMGALLTMPFFFMNWAEIAAACQQVTVWGTAMAEERPYTAVDWTQPAALIIGNEANGMSAAAVALTQGQVAIPMESDIDSLNAAIAAAVILFEAQRQRTAS